MSDYLEKLKDPRWQKFKALVHIRDNWTCTNCGTTERTLVAHHLRYNGEPWQSDFSDVITVCVFCHAIQHGSNPIEMLGQHGKDRLDSAERIVSELMTSGVRLWPKKNGRVGYDAPAGKLDSDLLRFLVGIKPEILWILSTKSG